ncbi:helix-turn-helix domain-containing protein [Leptospira sp. GIMC2001]|uniref:helix-turn-helix domain-containing protein n=1 Tax=Leptospira sp. GIMC2001 TaxID=1513297 RepID=UPI00234A0FCB|nr:helix-turn-helix domain-containing protein [Leptospira sp. GIMC2001]WCL51446.1 helix-turn-helix domain-containing protein [Leptospira sp. GIMC2001]
MKKKKFTFAPLTALLNLSGQKALVYTTLLTFQGANEYAWPTLQAISDRMGGKIKPKRISQITNELKREGWLIIIRRGFGRSNKYQCTFPPDLLFVPNYNEQPEIPAIPQGKISKLSETRITIQSLGEAQVDEWVPDKIEEWEYKYLSKETLEGVVNR